MTKQGNSPSTRVGQLSFSRDTRPQVANVIVRASAAEAAKTGTEPYDLVQAVIDFVNLCINEFHYTPDEIPQKAMQAYHADFYLAQVNNGGHSQFIHNSRNAAEATFRDAQAGLAAMGAPHARILEAMLKWANTNQKEAETQNGFEARNPYLDSLDSELYAEEEAKSMIDYSVRWILSWPELRAVPDSMYLEEMAKLKSSNHKFTHRRVLKTVWGIEYDCTDEMQVAIGMALASLPKPEVLVWLGGGGYEDIEGQQQMAFFLKSNNGERQIVLGDTDVRLFEYAKTETNRAGALFRAFKLDKIFGQPDSQAHQRATVGKRINIVPKTKVSEVIEMSKSNQAGAAIGLLLVSSAQIFPPPTIAAHAVLTRPDGTKSIIWLVSTEKGQLEIETTQEWAVARNSVGQSVVAKCSRSEASAYLAKLTADADMGTPPG